MEERSIRTLIQSYQFPAAIALGGCGKFAYHLYYELQHVGVPCRLMGLDGFLDFIDDDPVAAKILQDAFMADLDEILSNLYLEHYMVEIKDELYDNIGTLEDSYTHVLDDGFPVGTPPGYDEFRQMCPVLLNCLNQDPEIWGFGWHYVNDDINKQIKQLAYDIHCFLRETSRHPNYQGQSDSEEVVPGCAGHRDCR